MGGARHPASDPGNGVALALRVSRLQELFGVDAGLFEDRAQCALGHVAGMVGEGGVAVGGGVVPDFVRAGGLAMELEAGAFEPLHDVAISEASEAPHQRLTMRG